MSATQGTAASTDADRAVVTRAGGAPAGSEPTCLPRRFGVKVGSDTDTVAGSLCRHGRADKKIRLITAHGATYNHLYWDWPQHPAVYSLVRNVVSARVSVLNLDLLGSGESSRPSSSSLPMKAQASMLHQVVRTMRAEGFKKVILVGHSSGSGTFALEASTYHDIEGLIVTGFLHPQPALNTLVVPLSLYPAALDPASRARILTSVA